MMYMVLALGENQFKTQTINFQVMYIYCCEMSAQILIYPRVVALDDYSLKSYSEYESGPIIARDLIQW